MQAHRVTPTAWLQGRSAYTPKFTYHGILAHLTRSPMGSDLEAGAIVLFRGPWRRRDSFIFRINEEYLDSVGPQ